MYCLGFHSIRNPALAISVFVRYNGRTAHLSRCRRTSDWTGGFEIGSSVGSTAMSSLTRSPPVWTRRTQGSRARGRVDGW
jgi:hypothetical protein